MTVHTNTIYFDHNATTAVADECLAAMDACLRLGPINPSSKHSLGDRAKGLMSTARSAVAEAFGASPAEMVFTAAAPNRIIWQFSVHWRCSHSGVTLSPARWNTHRP